MELRLHPGKDPAQPTGSVGQADAADYEVIPGSESAAAKRNRSTALYLFDHHGEIAYRARLRDNGSVEAISRCVYPGPVEGEYQIFRAHSDVIRSLQRQG